MVSLLELAGFYVLTTVIWACIWAWIATKARGTKFGGAVALPLDFLAVFWIGFALERLLMQLTGAIPGGQHWPDTTWHLLLGITGLVIAVTAKPNGWFAVIPRGIIGALKITHGIRSWVNPEYWLYWGDLELDKMIPAAHASLYAGIIMICIGIAVMTEIPRMKSHPNVCEFFFGLMSAGILTIPWLLPIAWYWRVAVLLGFVQLAAFTKGFFEFALRAEPTLP